MSTIPADFEALLGQIWLVDFDLHAIADAALLNEVGSVDGQKWIGRVIDTNDADREDADYCPTYQWRCDQVDGTATVYLLPGAVTPVRQLATLG